MDATENACQVVRIGWKRSKSSDLPIGGARQHPDWSNAFRDHADMLSIHMVADGFGSHAGVLSTHMHLQTVGTTQKGLQMCPKSSNDAKLNQNC